jgi:hypothetical protein
MNFLDKKKMRESFELILNGLNKHTLDNDEDIYLIYKKVAPDDISYANFLDSFLIFVRKCDDMESYILDITNRIRPIIQKERAKIPYAGVNDRERRILLAIADSAQKGEASSIKHHLSDLSIALINNQKALHRSRTTNKWTIPISIISILLTLFIWLYGSTLSEKDVDRISNKIYTTISDSLSTTKSDSLVIK